VTAAHLPDPETRGRLGGDCANNSKDRVERSLQIANRIGVDVSTNLYTFVAGPKLGWYDNPKFAPYVQVLFGAARTSASATAPGFGSSFDVSTTGFDVQPGGGVDVMMNKSMWIRLGINADYIRAEGETAKEFQFIAGVVFRR
jgi:hypothetical protein